MLTVLRRLFGRRAPPSEGLAAASAQIGPSEACERLLDEVRATHVGSVPFEIYWNLPAERLSYGDQPHFRRAWRLPAT